MMSTIAPRRNDTRVLAAMLLAALLAACAGGPFATRESTPPAAKPAPALTLPQIEELARTALPAERPRYQLDAVALLLQQNQPDQAQTWLRQINAPTLDTLQRARYQEMQARLALARNQPRQALDQLQDARLLQTTDQLPASQQAALALVKAQALTAGRDYLGSARERSFVDGLLQGAPREQNRQELWRALQALDANTLTQARASAGEEEWRGWLDLALVYKRAQGNPTLLANGLEQWKRQWRAHPGRAQLSALTGTSGTVAAAPIAAQQVALLLPLNGKLAGFGTAIRDGFMAAWYDARSRGAVLPAVRLYDTSEAIDAPRFLALYQRAVADGAQAVIGPLEKPQVGALYGSPLPVPTLALNRADLASAPPPQLYQFGLAPEDEANAVARIASAQRARHALIVAPADERNARELQAFQTSWQQQGGDVVATAWFDDPQLLSQAIKNALNIPASEARKREIETLLGRRVEFAPHRRGDIDMVFVLARPQQARSVLPTLAYHYAGDIPTYALSRSYNGFDAPDQDRDLEGLRFTEMPWLLDAQQPLKQQILAANPQGRSYLRLYALGVDSFALLPQLQQLESQPGRVLDGQTGALTLSPARIVERDLPLAQFGDGLARRYDGAARNNPGTESPIDANTPVSPQR